MRCNTMRQRISMSSEKKEKPVKVKCSPHHFVVTGWTTKGGIQSANQMRCAQCLLVVCLEQLNSQEWKDKNGI
jgi:ABC-type molybdenum transport system ATPase subunit/photorepair protein PhrA